MFDQFLRQCLLAIAVCFAAAVAPAGAQLIAYEGFDYASGAKVGSTDTNGDPIGIGGTGWATPWTGTAEITAYSTTLLSYTDANEQSLPTVGMGVRAGRLGRSISRTVALQGTSPGTYWFTLMMRPTYTVQTTGTIDYGFELIVRNGSTARFTVGDFTAGTNFGLRAGTTGTPSYSDTSAEVTDENGAFVHSTHFLAIKYTVGSASDDGSIHLFMDPLLGTEPLESAADASLLGLNSANMTFNTIALNTPGAGVNVPRSAGIWDEIRIGTTWSSVTTVPEPGSAAVLSVAGLALLRRRRVG